MKRSGLIFLLLAGCGGLWTWGGANRADAPRFAVRWEGNADLDIEIWNAAGTEYLRDAAGDSAASDAAGGERQEETWTPAVGFSETSVVLAVGCWDFHGETEVRATAILESGGGPREIRAALSPSRNVWKAFRWDRATGQAVEIGETAERRLGE